MLFTFLQLPVITDLCNPTIRDRHWKNIYEVLEYTFDDAEDPMTLGKLNEIDAFRHTETIQEISGQASSEASLETILKKVCINFFILLLFFMNF